VVHVVRGDLPGLRYLDGRAVARISAYLFHRGGDSTPAALRANAELSFQGTIVLGMEFTFDDNDKKNIANPISLMRQLLDASPTNRECIRPYWGGAELNETWTFQPTRFVIDFDSLPEDEARSKWPDVMTLVERRVKPARLLNEDERARKYWWQFLRPRAELYDRLRNCKRTLVIARNSNTGAFLWMPATHIFSEKTVVFPVESDAFAAILQSRVHDMWSRVLNTTFKDDLQYTPSECFDNFPLPERWEQDSTLAEAGRRYFEYRSALVNDTKTGLTDLFTSFHDPLNHSAPIETLRELHEIMDRAVLDAYGWRDIQANLDFILDYEERRRGGGRKSGQKEKAVAVPLARRDPR
jgi:hypothetical protein